MAWLDTPQAEAMICQFTQELIPQGMFALWESSAEDDKKLACSDF